jgi:Subtilase family/Secretion system C-terminal sorting domain/Csp protease B prodomain
MKRLLVLAAIVLCLIDNLHSQTTTSITNNKFDPSLNLLLSKKESGINSVVLSKQNDNTIGVIINSADISKLKSYGYDVNSTFGNYATVRIKLSDLQNLSKLSIVNFISLGPTYHTVNDVTGAVTGSRLLNSGFLNNTQYTGKHVLICDIDTGIDWSDLDFRNPTDTTKSRIIYIWDQTLTKQGSEQTPQDRDPVDFLGLNYGVEYTQAEIDNEIDGTPAGFVRERDTNGHGTDVVGVAAGNGSSLPSRKYAGVAPEADILIIKASNGSSQTSNIIDGISYASKIASSLNEPIVINLSLGSEDDPHDGTSIFDQAVDNFTSSANGRIIVAAAGNNGNANIHIGGTIGNSATVQIPISVPSYSPVSGADANYFGFDLWSESSGSETSTVTAPNSHTINNGTSSTTEGTVYLSNSLNGNNNEREIYMYVYNGTSSVNPASGTWTLNITNTSGSTIQYNGWLFASSMNAVLSGGNNNYTIESPGTATNAITVGSYVTRWRWQDMYGNSWEYSGTDFSDNISSFSSIGPRVDGVQKPDITAPGQGIISTRSSSSSPDSSYLVEGGKYFVSQGTSFASPATCGCAALLLQQDPNLNYSQVKSLLENNAESDNYTSSTPNYIWGYGKLNVYNAMADLINPSSPKNYSVFAYDQWNSSAYTNIAPNNKFAIKFTPNFTGEVTGALLHTYTSINISGSIYFEIWSDNNGLPGTKLGSTVAYSASELLPFTWNYIDLTGTNVTVNNGNAYHLVAYFTSGSQTGIFVDAGNPNSGSSYFDGTGWSIKSNYNYRMRVIVASNDTSITSIQSPQLTGVPNQYELYQNYPNPFNPSTIIKYSIEKAGFVTLKIYDILGREIKTLINEKEPAGNYIVRFNAANLSSGVYFYSIHSGDFIQYKKMILLK